MVADIDLVISGGTVIDGSGGPPRRADVAVADDRIAAVGAATARPGGRVIDADGLAVAPGFIDVHTHDDFAAVIHPDMAFKVCGGVTTCVVGNCGMGAAPFETAQIIAGALHPDDELPGWDGYTGYLGYLDEHPPSVNIAALVGHGTVRAAVMGLDDRAPTGAELDAMRDLVREGLAAGAVGLSTGLIYEPSRYATTDELVDLAGEARGTGALYASHLRNEGSRLLEAVSEALEIGERAGVPVQISHHKAAGRENWGSVESSLQLVEDARERGISVHADQYPYTAGSTILSAVAETLATGADSPIGELATGDVVVASTRSHPEWEGRSLDDLADELGLAPEDVAEAILSLEPGATAIIHSMDEADVRTVMAHESTMIGSDGLPTLDGAPHPRLYGTFARVLGRYARDEGVLTVPEAVRRMTALSAGAFGLADRGVVAPGAVADLVVFDPDEIIDVGTYDDPKHPPRGIHHVFVGGREVVSGGEHTGARPGPVIRRNVG